MGERDNTWEQRNVIDEIIRGRQIEGHENAVTSAREDWRTDEEKVKDWMAKAKASRDFGKEGR